MSFLELLALVKKYGPLIQQLGPYVSQFAALIKEIVSILRTETPPTVGASTDITLDEFCAQSGLSSSQAKELMDAFE